MLTLEQVKNNPFVLEFLKKSKESLKAQNFTDHGYEHGILVAKRCQILAKEIGLSKKEQELTAIAGFVHDFGNFLSRLHHDCLGGLLFQNIFPKDFNPDELTLIMRAIANHDSFQEKFFSPISAIVVISDKSDVRRSRVIIKDERIIKSDIHNRVNFAVTKNRLTINKKNKNITLILKIDTNFVPIMEYFEIFTERMIQCRKAARFLGYKFGLIINKFKLL